MKRDRLFFVVLVGIFLLLLLYLFTVVRSEQRDRQSRYSTYRSDPLGSRAFFLLAKEMGFRPKRIRHQLRLIEEDGLLFLIEPWFLQKPEHKGLEEWVKAGNTLIIATNRSLPILAKWGYGLQTRHQIYHKQRTQTKPDYPYQWQSESAHEKPTDPLPYSMDKPIQIELQGVRYLYPIPKNFRLLYHQNGLPRIGISPLGQGQIIVMASASIFSNAGIRRQDNVHFLTNFLSLYGQGKSVLFDEYHHGYRHQRTFMAYLQRRGLHLALYQLIGALLFALWLGGTRFGPLRKEQQDEESTRKGDYIDALANLYAKAHTVSHVAKLLAWDLRRSLLQSLGGRAIRDTLTLTATLRKRQHPYAERIPSLLLDLEKAANNQKNLSEIQLLALTKEVDLIKEKLQDKTK